MIALGLLVPYAYPEYSTHYFALLIFLGLGLKPILVITGIGGWISSMQHSICEKKYAKITEERRKQIDAELELKKRRRSRLSESMNNKN